MSVKPSEEEEKYFQRENQRQLQDLKSEQDADEATKARWNALSLAAGLENLSLGHQLELLGFNTETVRALFFMPLVEIAWADGKIGYKESRALVDAIRARGVRATSEAFEFLDRVTRERPSEDFFRGAEQVIRGILAGLDPAARAREVEEISALAEQVARADRGFFGLGAAVSEEERGALVRLVDALGLTAAERASLLKRL